MFAKSWKSEPRESFNPEPRASRALTVSSRSDPPPSTSDGSSRRRGRPKENLGVRRRRQQDQAPTGEPIPRLPRLSLRVKAIRKSKEPPRPFSDAPPTLADLVCISALEANLVRPNQILTVSVTELPSVRVDPRTAPAIQACLIYLMEHASYSIAGLKANATLAGSSHVVVEFSLPADLNTPPSNDPAPGCFDELQALHPDFQITISPRAASLTLPIAATAGAKPDS